MQSVKKIKIQYHPETLRYDVVTPSRTWVWREAYRPYFLIEQEKIYFDSARSIDVRPWHSGLGDGLYSVFSGFHYRERPLRCRFATLVWHIRATGEVRFEWIPLEEDVAMSAETTDPAVTRASEAAPVSESGVSLGLISEVHWPGPFDFRDPSLPGAPHAALSTEEIFPDSKSRYYTLLPFEQGLLIPDDWPVELGPITFNGLFGTSGAYLPCFAQTAEGDAYLAICRTPENAGYEAVHPAGGPSTEVSFRLEPSLGFMRERRVMSYYFFTEATPSALARAYREDAEKHGKVRTLRQKALQNPNISRLVGSFFVHEGIKTKVSPQSDFFDPADPEKNNHLTTFAERQREVAHWQALGIRKLYLHLDGWAEPGYDNQHPDFFPACEAAGGWSGLKALFDAIHEAGYLIGLHDQYRDYYLDAQSYDPYFACRLADGSVPAHARWAGGPQNFLCTTFAPDFVERNLNLLFEHGLHPDCYYLDVFTCNEGDECAHPDHRMDRRLSYEYRKQCFTWLSSQDILPSSEEVNDWAATEQVFCHYAPYDFMLREPGAAKYGIPFPFYNLVYHDCVLQPWMMDRVRPEEDYSLYALINGGAPYYFREGAYPDIDGAYKTNDKDWEEEQVRRCQQVADFHELVALEALVSVDFIGGDPWVQRSTFGNGQRVTVDFRRQTFSFDKENETANLP